MFYGFGYFNNPFMMNTCSMPSYSFMMPCYSSNFAMPQTYVNPTFSFLYSMPEFKPEVSTYPSLFGYQTNSSINTVRIPTFEVKSRNHTVPKITTPIITTPEPHKPATSEQVTVTRKQKTVTHSQKAVVQQTKTQQTQHISRRTVKPSKIKKELGPEFLKRVKEISKNLKCNYKDLLAVMNAESGLNSKAVNKNGGATGLIQFMPATARCLGTTTKELKNMTPLEQLDYVEKYLMRNKKAAGFSPKDKLNGGDLYALIFLPARAKRETLTDHSEKYYAPNKGLDTNKDGKITSMELAQRVARFNVNESIFA